MEREEKTWFPWDASSPAAKDHLCCYCRLSPRASLSTRGKYSLVKPFRHLEASFLSSLHCCCCPKSLVSCKASTSRKSLRSSRLSQLKHHQKKTVSAYPQNRKELPKCRRHDISRVSRILTLAFFSTLTYMGREKNEAQIAIIIKALGLDCCF